MVADVIGGAVMMAGGGMLTASSVSLSLRRQWRSAAEFGKGLADACADTVTAPLPDDVASLIASLP